MSKYNPDYPAYHTGGKRVTRHEFITKLHGKEIADASDRGPYWYGSGHGGHDGLQVWTKTVWPRGLDLATVFPLVRKEDPRMPHTVGDFSSFLVASKPVQSDYNVAAASIKKQYNSLLSLEISDLRAIRKETDRALRRYLRSVDSRLMQIRTVLGVLYVESRNIIDPDPNVPVEALSKDVTSSLGDLNYLFIQRFWQSALIGGPGFWEGAEELATRLQFAGTSEALVRFQSEALHALLVERDAVIVDALPVEYQRLACENILWKIAHGEQANLWDQVEEGQVEASGMKALLSFTEAFPLKTLEKQYQFFRYTEWLEDNLPELVSLKNIGDVYSLYAKSEHGRSASVTQKLESELRRLGEEIDSLGVGSEDKVPRRIAGMIALCRKYIQN